MYAVRGWLKRRYAAHTCILVFVRYFELLLLLL